MEFPSCPDLDFEAQSRNDEGAGPTPHPPGFLPGTFRQVFGIFGPPGELLISFFGLLAIFPEISTKNRRIWTILDPNGGQTIFLKNSYMEFLCLFSDPVDSSANPLML